MIRLEAGLLFCAFWSVSVFAQVEKSTKLHTPSEIIKIMEDSKLTYEIGYDYVAAPLDSPVVLSNQMYLRKKENDYYLEMFSLSDQAKPVYDQAEEAFHNQEFTKALTLYRQVLAVQPEYFHALTLIGDAYFSMSKFDSAKTYFLRSIDLNFADYNAHWFLADTYKRLDNMEEAAREATIAHLLNVNHLNLQKAIRYYREQTNRPWKEWTFDPQYTLSKDGNKVVIKTTPEWMGYALVKAVWAYEPGYAESMLREEKNNLVIVWPEEKEAIVGALLNNDRLKHINDIIDKGFFTEFILYEVAAKKHPSLLVLLPREAFMRVAEYVNAFH
jgi:tetratricopeptide (TPR) repeat protein